MKKRTKKLLLYLGIFIALLVLFIQASQAHSKLEQTRSINGSVCDNSAQTETVVQDGFHLKGIVKYKIRNILSNILSL